MESYRNPDLWVVKLQQSSLNDGSTLALASLCMYLYDREKKTAHWQECLITQSIMPGLFITEQLLAPVLCLALATESELSIKNLTENIKWKN